jgi:hypothetical protein
MNELDIALERLHLCAFETAEGVPNCGPMAALALENLGHSALTSGLMDVYVPRFPVLGDGSRLNRQEWSSARGDMARALDWLATFDALLAERDWKDVLTETLDAFAQESAGTSLAPDALLRLAYATRALEGQDSAPRRRELAFALAFTAAKSASSPNDTENPNPWAAQVRNLAEGPEGSAEDIAKLVGEFCLAGATQYVGCEGERSLRTASVVLPSAFRFLLSRLPLHLARDILIAMLSGCAVTDTAQESSGSADKGADTEVERCAESVIEIRYRAACSVHEHAILMADACLRENEIRPNPIFCHAAADAALRLSPPGYQEWR